MIAEAPVSQPATVTITKITSNKTIMSKNQSPCTKRSMSMYPLRSRSTVTIIGGHGRQKHNEPLKKKQREP